MKRTTWLGIALAAVSFLASGLRLTAADLPVPPAARGIALEIAMVRSAWGPHDDRARLLSGPIDEVAARLQEFESGGQIIGIDRVSLTTLEHQEAQLQVGQVTQLPSGRNAGRGGGPAQVSYEAIPLGTVIRATPYREGDSSILVTLTVEKSELERTEPANGNGDETTPRGTETLTSKSLVRVEDGATVLVGAFENSANAKSSAQFILVSARLLPPSTAANEAASNSDGNQPLLKVFSLQRMGAAQAVRLVEALGNQRLRAAVDERTNSLVVHGPASQLDHMEAILQRLDASDAWSREETPELAKQPSAESPESSRYNNMDKETLQAELRRLQTEIAESMRKHREAEVHTNEARRAYRNASDEAKPEALLKLLEAQAAERAPERTRAEAESRLQAAKKAYLHMLTAE